MNVDKIFRWTEEDKSSGLLECEGGPILNWRLVGLDSV